MQRPDLSLGLTSMPTPELKPGMWLRWTTPERMYEGRIVSVFGPSLQVQWLGVDHEQVFPIHEQYWPPRGTGFEVIDKPRGADRIERDAKADKMSIRRASAMLGVEPKRLRAMLRSGAIRGGQIDGKWSWINGEDVAARMTHG